MSITVQQAVDGALRGLGVLPVGVSASGSKMTEAITTLAQILRTWEAQGMQGWLRKINTFSLVVGTASYTLGSGGTGLAERPNEVHAAWLRDTDGDVELRILERKEYFGLFDKADAGDPAGVFYDPQSPLGKLYVYPVTESSGQTLVLDYSRSLTTVSAASDVLDVTPEAELAIKWNLAMELSPSYRLKLSESVVANAAKAQQALLGGSRQVLQQPFFGWPGEE